MQTRAKAIGINVTVTGVTVQPIVQTSGGGTTKAPEASPTTGSRDRVFHVSYPLTPLTFFF
jgi:hypothetical protein